MTEALRTEIELIDLEVHDLMVNLEILRERLVRLMDMAMAEATAR